MATPSDIRRLALVALYQLDARPNDDRNLIREALSETVLHSLDEEMHDDEGCLFVTTREPFNARDERRAFELAQDAFGARMSADNEFEALAPDWPPRRQAAIDRAILRLAHFEILAGKVPAKVAVNEAVELAKAFSTEKSPAFINGLLGKVIKRVQGESGGVSISIAAELASTGEHADAYTDADLTSDLEADLEADLESNREAGLGADGQAGGDIPAPGHDRAEG